jgi:Glycogen recognition site of AMP-activated protein kinase/Carbohydrate-binding module 48 (Isoamylase N-terminal domain)
MKRFIQHIKRYTILSLTWTVFVVTGHAQEENPAYYFEGEEVVFVFDVRVYAKALLGENALKVDFADLGIEEVAVTGQFNNWNKKGWKMIKRDEFTYELRKRIQDFNDAFPIDFRYIINGRYIADAEGQITDPRQFRDNFLEDIYKVDLSVIKIVEEGNVVFFLAGYPNANQVILSGSFNGWNEQALKMNKVDNGWELHAELPPGRYEYKFIVDGEWMHDPANKETVKNEHYTLNSVLYVNVPVTFILLGYPDAKSVILAGSFNDWNEKKLQMRREDQHWITTLSLPGGKHTYKFIVDGKWITDPGNPIKEDDGYGNINSVRFVH